MATDQPNDGDKPKPEVDPEQLLKLLELQSRAVRTEKVARDSRTAFRVWSIVIIVAAAAIALWVLEFLLGQMAPPKDQAVKPAAIEAPR